MIKSESVELQGRTVLAWDAHRQPTANGTVLGAVAARAKWTLRSHNVTTSSSRVHVQMPTDRTDSKTSSLSLSLQ